MKLTPLIFPITLTLLTSSLPAISAYCIDLYSKPDYQGDQSTSESDGTHKVGWSGGAQSWIWTSEADDGCCVAFCRGSTNVGRYCGSWANPTSSAGTTKVVTGCGDTVLNC